MNKTLKKYCQALLAGGSIGLVFILTTGFDPIPVLIGVVGFSLMITEAIYCIVEGAEIESRKQDLIQKDKQQKILYIYPQIEELLKSNGSILEERDTSSTQEKRSRDKLIESIAADYKRRTA
jgi:xanthosine utilization system XapX-like protein